MTRSPVALLVLASLAGGSTDLAGQETVERGYPVAADMR